jgi:hypothetical protein
MKKFFALPLAALFVVACSESSTAPVSNSDLAPSYAKPTPPPAGCGTCTQIASYTFEGVDAAGGTSIGTDVQPGAASIADAPAVVTAPGGQHFIGRFDNTRTMVTINLPAGSAKYDLAFDFYTIGSWDGRGKQAQNGFFDANVFQLGYRCSAANAPTPLFTTSFSNQLTVQQDFPLAFLQGGNKAATGSYGTDLLNYKSVPSQSNTPVFRSFGDVEYHMSSVGNNPCGTGAVTFTISTSNPTQQSKYDESWGVDNIVIKTGN